MTYRDKQFYPGGYVEPSDEYWKVPKVPQIERLTGPYPPDTWPPNVAIPKKAGTIKNRRTHTRE